MAKMVPPRIYGDAPMSERKVFDVLEELPDDWTVFHSVGWQAERHGRQGDGEADFVLMSKRGLIVLEVKGGDIQLTEGRWTSTSRTGRTAPIRDPFQQALDSRKALVRYLADRVPGQIETGHAVCFPDVRVDRDLGPEGPRSIMIDRDGLGRISESVGRIANHWQLGSGLSDAWLAAIRKAIAPTVSVKPLLREVVEDVNTRLLELTEQQVAALALLRRKRRAIVYGSAGTGKTVLAVERARQLAADGFEVLLLCYNRPLGRFLQRSFPIGGQVTAGSFHAFGHELARSSGIRVPKDPADSWWDKELPELLPGLGWKTDALVIDEGQDFMPDWWTVLELMLHEPEHGPFYVFADSAQQIYRPGWDPPFEEPSADLSINCRNTLQIARHVSSVFGMDVPTLGASGPEPVFYPLADDGQLNEKLRRVMSSYRSGGIAPGQITVLSSSRAQVDALRGSELGGIRLCAPGERGVVTETVHRFKGLESDVVILSLPSIESDGDRALAYIGMSRAKAQLAVLGPPALESVLGW